MLTLNDDEEEDYDVIIQRAIRAVDEQDEQNTNNTATTTSTAQSSSRLTIPESSVHPDHRLYRPAAPSLAATTPRIDPAGVGGVEEE